MKKWLQVLAAAAVLAVPTLAVCAFAPLTATGEAVAIAPQDDPVANGLAIFKQPAGKPVATKPVRPGLLPAEVLAQEWIATKRPKPSTDPGK